MQQINQQKRNMKVRDGNNAAMQQLEDDNHTKWNSQRIRTM